MPIYWKMVKLKLIQKKLLVALCLTQLLLTHPLKITLFDKLFFYHSNYSGFFLPGSKIRELLL